MKKIFEEYIIKKYLTYQNQKSLKTLIKKDILVSSDYNSSCPSAMAHNDSKWPKLETSISIK